MAADADRRRHTDVKADLTAERDQLWAEAVERWKEGETLYLPTDLEAEARQKQAEHNDEADDPIKDMLIAYLDMKLPGEWQTWDLRRRRAYITDPDPLDQTGTEERTRVCAAEFICERLRKDMADKEYKYLARKVGRLMDDLTGWERGSTSRHAERLYGRQLAWLRKEVEDDDI